MGGNQYAETKEAEMEEVVAAITAKIKADSSKLAEEITRSLLKEIKAAGYKIVK